VTVERVGFELREHLDPVVPGVHEVVENKVDNAIFTREVNGGVGAGAGQDL